MGLRVKFSDAENNAFANWAGDDAQNESVVVVKQEPDAAKDVQDISLAKTGLEAPCEIIKHVPKRKRGDVSDCESEDASASEKEELGPRKISALPGRLQSKKVSHCLMS